MRCRWRRLVCFLLVALSSFVLYETYPRTPESNQEQFTILRYRNQSYRIPSSSFKYDSQGSYLNFAYFRVEQRQRVLRIDSHYDVPVSSQWQSKGHLYPTQIAQFGLSHWSWLSLNPRTQRETIQQFAQIATNRDGSCSSWHPLNQSVALAQTFIHFTMSSHCSLHVQFLRNNLTLIYTTRRIREHKANRTLVVFIGRASRVVNRHMLVDIEKLRGKAARIEIDQLRIQVCGHSNSTVDRLSISNATMYNDRAFHAATDWLLANQDRQTGCWFIQVQRHFGNDRQYHLPIPWCSAMAQGQAASLLVRLYSQTRDSEHLLALRRAVQPLWSSNRTRAYFNSSFLWLEEYPLATPARGLFVLNGCLYALVGLVDVQSIDPQPHLAALINELLSSLNQMLPLYVDPHRPNWSLYDLSHLTIGSKVNRASFAYHLVHITLLQCLSNVFRQSHASASTFFDQYARRFRSALEVKTNSHS